MFIKCAFCNSNLVKLKMIVYNRNSASFQCFGCKRDLKCPTILLSQTQTQTRRKSYRQQHQNQIVKSRYFKCKNCKKSTTFKVTNVLKVYCIYCPFYIEVVSD